MLWNFIDRTSKNINQIFYHTISTMQNKMIQNNQTLPSPFDQNIITQSGGIAMI